MKLGEGRVIYFFVMVADIVFFFIKRVKETPLMVGIRGWSVGIYLKMKNWKFVTPDDFGGGWSH